MTRLHTNAMILGAMLFALQLVILLMPGSEGEYIPLLSHMMGGNGDNQLTPFEGILIPMMFSPMGALILTMKWFSGMKANE